MPRKIKVANDLTVHFRSFLKTLLNKLLTFPIDTILLILQDLSTNPKLLNHNSYPKVIKPLN